MEEAGGLATVILSREGINEYFLCSEVFICFWKGGKLSSEGGKEVAQESGPFY